MDMDKQLFKNGQDYWQVAEIIRDIYLSDGSLLTLLDFERVIDELDIYAFRNWSKGELVSGPDISKYKVTCTFMWPEKLMPDPRGGRRLLPFDCTVNYKKTKIKIPIKIENPSDLDQAYEQDLDKEEFKDQDQQTDIQSDTQNMQGGMPNVGQAPAI